MVMNLSNEYLMENSTICLQPKSNDDDIFKFDELDLEAYIRVNLGNVGEEMCTFKLPKALYSYEILEKAVENTKNSFVIESLSDVLGISGFVDEVVPIDVVSNKNRIYGGSALAFPEIFYDYCIKKGVKNIFIIPSSIHELLIIRDNGDFDANELTTLINLVNSTEVRDCDVLSDHVYLYDIKAGITWGSKSWFERAFKS